MEKSVRATGSGYGFVAAVIGLGALGVSACGDGEATTDLQPSGAGGNCLRTVCTGGAPSSETNSAGESSGGAQTTVNGTSSCQGGWHCGGATSLVETGGYGGSLQSGGSGGTSIATMTQIGGNGPLGCVTVTDCGTAPPCTRRDCDSGQCRESTEPDGTVCDDGNVCTTADRCVAGACIGTARTSSPSLLSTVPLFGGFRAEDQPVQGLVEVLDREHVLFAERLAQGAGHTALILTRVGTKGLELVDRVLSPLKVEIFQDMGLDWTQRVPAYLVPVGPRRFAYVAARAGIEVYDYSTDKLKLSSSLPLSAAEPTIYDVAWAKGRLWICAGVLKGYTVSDDGKVSSAENISVGSGCYDLAVSEDEQRLFVSNSMGIFAVQLSEPPTVTHQTTGFSRHSSLTASGEYVAGIRVVAAGLAGSVGLFRANDLSSVTTLPAPADGKVTSLALYAGELFMQVSRPTSESSSVSLERYSIANDAVSLRGTQLIRNSSGSRLYAYGNPVPMSVRKELAAVQPWRDVLRITPDGILPITGIQHGAIEQLAQGAPNTLDGFGPDSVYRFDITDPRHPIVLGGGRVLGPYVKELRLVTGIKYPRLSNVASFSVPISQVNPTAEVAQMTSRSSTLPTQSGTLTLDGGPAVLDSSNGQVFQVSSPTASTYRVRRFGKFPEGGDSTNHQLVSDFDRTFTVATPTDWPTRSSWRFTASADGGLLALVEFRSGVAAGKHTDWLRILPLTEQSAPLIAEVQLNYPSLVEMAEGRVLVASDSAIDTYGFDGASLKLLVRRTETQGRQCRRILYWDGKTALLATQEWRNDLLVGGVWALSGDDLSERAYYETGDEILSFTAAGENYAFASNSGLTIAAPACQ